MQKTKIKIKNILYPKYVEETNDGDYCIFTASVIEHLTGDKPFIHPVFGTMTLKGVCGKIKIGDRFTAFYDEKEENSFGISYKLISLTKELDKYNAEELETYLTFICGENIAKELMEIEDVNPLDLLKEKNDERLLQVKGIKESKLKQIYKKLEDYEAFDVALIKLRKFNLTTNLIQKICLAYGSPNTAIEICENNPYDLIKKVRGISFKKADEIAKKCCLNMSSANRLEGLIYYILDEKGNEGKTFLTVQQLQQEISENSSDMGLLAHFENVILKMIENKDIIVINNKISLKYYFELEKNIASQICRLINAKTDIEIPENWKEIVKELEEEQGWEHTSEQWEGIESVLKNNVTVITGKAGTGKSTVVNAITRVLEDYEIAMTCLSAKASKRISEVTGKPAMTIHRLLGIGTDGKRIDDSQLWYDILVIDESSMVNGTLFHMLLSALRDGTKVIILGDDGQLQPIGDCSVFSDMLKVEKLGIIRLTEIHRQAQKSAIITKSIEVREQKQIYPKGFLGKMILGELKDLELSIHKENDLLLLDVLESFEKEYLKNNCNILETQVITALKTKGNLSTQRINNEIQKRYIDCSGKCYKDEKRNLSIYVGDKVINTKNNYNIKTRDGETYPIFNGHIGIVKRIEESYLIINFDNVDVVFSNSNAKHLNLAYAITIHSSQGSQWNSVIVALDNSAWIMLTTEMLYTALTRASKHCILVGQDNAIKQAIRSVEQNTKQTYLNNFLENNL